MSKRQSVTLAGLVAATRAQTQLNHNDNDVEVDLGNISSFVVAVVALSGDKTHSIESKKKI
jgi:hypothetical protein